MVRSIIRYVGLTAVVIGIVVLMSSLFTKDDSEFKSIDKKNNAKYYTASIQILDKETKKFITGGEFVLKTKTGKIIDEWEATENIHRVTNLSNGTYVIVQKSAVDGYEASGNVTFKISDSSKDVFVYNKMKEKKEVISQDEVNVDNTLSVKNYFNYIISLVIIGLGLGIVISKKSLGLVK